MSSSVHYKVKTGQTLSSNWSTIHFDGIHIKAFDLKQKIIYAEGMMRSEADAGTFDLQVVNSQNAEEYRDDGYHIHRNVSVIVKKVPASNPITAKKLYIPPGSLPEDWNKSTSTWVPPGMQDSAGNSNLQPLGARGSTGAGEDDGVAAAIRAAGQYASAPRVRSGPFQEKGQRGVVTAATKPPHGYVCHRCKQSGHFIQFCPTNGDSNYDLGRRGATTREDREKERADERARERERDSKYLQHVHAAPVSTEKSVWLKPIEDPKALTDGTSSTTAASTERGPAKFVYASGFFSSTTTGAGQVPYVAPRDTAQAPVPPPTALTYQYSDPSSSGFAPAQAGQSKDLAVTLRPDLACPLCKDYFVNAQVSGCCYTSYCDECIRKHLLTTPACPSCSSTDATADDLQPNVNLQKAVEVFLKENPSVERGVIKRAREEAKQQQIASSSSNNTNGQMGPNRPPVPVPAPASGAPSTYHPAYPPPSTNVAPPPPPSSAAPPSNYPQPNNPYGAQPTGSHPAPYGAPHPMQQPPQGYPMPYGAPAGYPPMMPNGYHQPPSMPYGAAPSYPYDPYQKAQNMQARQPDTSSSSSYDSNKRHGEDADEDRDRKRQRQRDRD